jgi:hypothetical protein
MDFATSAWYFSGISLSASWMLVKISCFFSSLTVSPPEFPVLLRQRLVV